MTAIDDDTDAGPGPHTCVYVVTDRGDQCEVCGHVVWRTPRLGQSYEYDLAYREDEWPDDGPEYDYDGGGA